MKIQRCIAGVLAAMVIFTLPAAAADAAANLEQRKETAHQMAECARKLGYSEDHCIIRTASEEWWAAHRLLLEMEEEALASGEETPMIPGENTAAEAEESPAAEKRERYAAAARAWTYLREEMGLSEPVAAGIIGSWMEECGGQTLDLQWWIYGGSGRYSYYGLAMWSLLYCPETAGMSLEQQLDYFAATLEKNMTFFGGDYGYFCSLTDPAAVVEYYYRYYGRGSGSPSAQRLQNGYTALAWFTGA